MIERSVVKGFQKKIWKFYAAHGRHSLPWRRTHDPYRIAVSEVMLQQTQVDRVIPYYNNFLRQFPTVQKLAAAKRADVLRAWQGLGYNRRGKYLHEMAIVVVRVHGGRMPKAREELEALPGVGRYTAGAVRAFAWAEPEVFIETNIRTVLLHHFFQSRTQVSDASLLGVAKEVLDRRDPRGWYAALMDYGSHLKKQGIKLNHRSKTYTKQSAFKGSTRELRGKIVTLQLSQKKRLSEKEIARRLKAPRETISRAYRALVREGMI